MFIPYSQLPLPKEDKDAYMAMLKELKEARALKKERDATLAAKREELR